MTREKNVLSRTEVEARIADGDLLVVYDGLALKLNGWLKNHPGGDLAILHMVGRDATQEMDVYHAAESLEMARKYAVGKVELPWKNFVAPIQGGKFRTRKEIEKCSDSDADSGVALSDSDKECSAESTECPSQPEPQQTHTILNDAGITGDVAWAGRESDFSAKGIAAIKEWDTQRKQKDLENYAPLEEPVQAEIVRDFRKLYKELEAEGWFQCTYWGYASEASRILPLFTVAYLLFQYRDGPFGMLSLFASAVFLGLGWHQLTFIVHDAGHLAITHNYYIDNLIGILIADFCGGLSVGWWKRNHNVHHIVTNDPVHDPDIQHLPFFAVSTRLFTSVKSTFYKRVLVYDAAAKFMLTIQHYTYYPILCFGRFNLYRLSWEHVIMRKGPHRGRAAWIPWVELAGLSFFVYWFFYLVIAKALHTAGQRWLYIMVSHIVTMPVHLQIVLSHFAMSTVAFGPDESFPARQIRSTMDIDCPEWLDFIHGGLQFQVIHHLFPRMPRHNFRRVQDRVRAFCDAHGLKYTIYGFVNGNKQVVSHLADIAKQARIFNECNEHCKREMVFGH